MGYKLKCCRGISYKEVQEAGGKMKSVISLIHKMTQIKYLSTPSRLASETKRNTIWILNMINISRHGTMASL